MRKTFYIIMFILFLIFICIFSSSTSGYYEYSNNKKSIYTEKKIKEFEKDIAEGKNVNISRLSYGIPMGVEIEYLDELTLLNALNDRKKIS